MYEIHPGGGVSIASSMPIFTGNVGSTIVENMGFQSFGKCNVKTASSAKPEMVIKITHLSRLKFPTSVNWTSPFSF